MESINIADAKWVLQNLEEGLRYAAKKQELNLEKVKKSCETALAYFEEMEQEYIKKESEGLKLDRIDQLNNHDCHASIDDGCSACKELFELTN